VSSRSCLNPDGRIDRLTDGLADTGEWLALADGERIIRLVAHHVGAEVHPSNPRVSAELPEIGERFEGLLPPIVAAPALAIGKPGRIISLAYSASPCSDSENRFGPRCVAAAIEIGFRCARSLPVSGDCDRRK
jgi:hypothetical protein